MNYIILDLEATCWRQKGQFQSEIIEIGAVAVDDKQNILGEYCSFVKPHLNPVLSDFCTELTTIQQEDVNDAPAFPEVLEDFLDWILSFGEDYWLGSWGFYDRSQFKRDCQLHNLSTQWLKKHISLKHQYAKIHALARPIGMPKALQREQIPLQGTHHRGIDDARNIVQLFLNNFDFWKFS